MNNPLKRFHPLSIVFFANAGFLVLYGFLTDFRYKTLHVILVVLSVVNALLIQWKHEKDD